MLVSLKKPAQAIAATGIPGLDHVLRGGFPSRRLYLIQGEPGVGKTTLALQFLLEGVRQREKALYVTLSETKDEIADVAASHDWSLDGLDIFEMSASEQVISAGNANTLFHPSEVELSAVMQRVHASIDEVRPTRVVFDSLSEIRMMAGDPLRYRREVLTLKSKLSSAGATVLLLDDLTGKGQDEQLQTLAHGVITLKRDVTNYGPARRRIEVSKLRGVAFRDGFHDYSILPGGLNVFPRLIASEHRAPGGDSLLSSGNTELDQLVGGGVVRGSSVLLMGPAGVGKSTVALTYAMAAAARGEKAAIFTFDESVKTLLNRAKGLGFDLASRVKSGLIQVRKIDPVELTPGQFASVLSGVVKDGVTLISIDGLNGYMNAMPTDQHLMLHLHELLAMLNSLCVTTFMVVAQSGVIGTNMSQPVDASYLADSVFLFRYYDFKGEVRQAVSVFKHRGGPHERTIRDMRLGPPGGIKIGPPLTEFRGVLTGLPIYDGDAKRSS